MATNALPQILNRVSYSRAQSQLLGEHAISVVDRQWRGHSTGQAFLRGYFR